MTEYEKLCEQVGVRKKLSQKTKDKISQKLSQKVEVKCSHCQKYFKVPPSRYKSAKRLFCSRECHMASCKTSKKVNCEVCGKEIVKNKFRLDQTEHNYCSYKCKAATLKKKNEIKIFNDYAIIFLETQKYGTKECLIDIEDIDKVKDFYWNTKPDNGQRWYVYSHNRFKREKAAIRLHRFITKCPKELQVDHINHNTLDNRKCNLNIVSHSENMQNKLIAKNNTSGITGVNWHKKDKKWVATIGINGRKIRLGSFADLEDAKRARLTAEEVHFKYKQKIKLLDADVLKVEDVKKILEG